MTDVQQATPYDGGFARMFELLEIPRIEAALDNDTIGQSCSDDEMLRYARIASVTVAGEFAAEHQEMRDNYGVRLWVVLCGVEEHGYYEIDGEPWLRDHNSHEPEHQIEVTDDVIRDWQWMMKLLSDRQIAARFLEQVPAHVRAEAADTVDLIYSRAFDLIVSDAENIPAPPEGGF